MSVIGKKILSFLNNPKKRKKGEKKLVPFEKAQHVGILYTWSNGKKEEVLISLMDKMGTEKKVEVLCFNPTKDPINTPYPTFDKSILTNFGKLNSEDVQQFMKAPFDYLFHLDFESNELLKNILIQTNAKCRIGVHSEEHTGYYELMIGINKSSGISNFADQMIKYVRAIR
ncbi:hypothetical protein BFP97_09155 [Roseivirga sp. 4D4]|uniref:DUF6913 domain-containing protein n=1 Tax=Roseivirga sp. 4D4 TaxID=1889784 RepID=UPI000853941B|nr:hypothetical protein [Roseivirga sp. 4D4]OEK01671.1 hypothetical protein BFP97_09155 [Roseivirga sp. 4D4]